MPGMADIVRIAVSTAQRSLLIPRWLIYTPKVGPAVPGSPREQIHNCQGLVESPPSLGVGNIVNGPPSRLGIRLAGIVTSNNGQAVGPARVSSRSRSGLSKKTAI